VKGKLGRYHPVRRRLTVRPHAPCPPASAVVPTIATMTDRDHVTETRAAYEGAADAYAQWVGTDLSLATEHRIDLALLASFADLVADTSGRRAADIGCGTGRVAAFLVRRGIDVVGVDLSPAMLAIASRTHPGIAFSDGRLSDLPLADGSVDGAVCWYSIIHTPPDQLAPGCRELARVVVPHGHVLMAFQAGDGEAVHRAAYGTQLPLTSYRHDITTVEHHLAAAGLRPIARTRREPLLAHESTPQAFVVARADTTR
jgi:ubiquinone/menaquinone biosynthesis C-methylase UbiE